MTPEAASALAKQMLSVKRYTHEANVVDAAVGLARLYGADEQKARLAGWLHDIVKEKSAAELKDIMQMDAGMAAGTAQRPIPVWHGPCAAIYAKHALGVDDEEVLGAVACHTTGKPDMKKLDKVLFVADMISAERDFAGVETLRQLACEDLDRTVLAVMQENIAYVKKKGKPLDKESLLALQWMQKH